MGNQANVYQLHEGQRVMPSKNGYISLWRDIKKQPFYTDLIARGMFLDMLLDAQHKSRKIEVDGVPVFLHTGQLFTKRQHFVEQGINDSKVKRVLASFEQLGIISRETIKRGQRSVGQRVTFLNWKKWQKFDQSCDQSSDQPHTAEIKGLNGDSDQSCDQSSDQENNNDLNNNKEYAGSATPPVHSELRKNAFNYFWKKWAECKDLVGLKNKAPKEKTYTNNFAKLFTDSYINRIGVDAFKAEVNQMCAFALEAHQDIASKQGTNQTSDYFNHEKMWPAKFLSNKQWREQA